MRGQFEQGANREERAKGRGMARKVAGGIREHEADYDQTGYAKECGTPSCIAGFTACIAAGELGSVDLTEAYCLLELDEEDEEGSTVDTAAVHAVAKSELELTNGETRLMFNGHPYGMSVEVRPSDAIRVLENYAETNMVWWPERS